MNETRVEQASRLRDEAMRQRQDIFNRLKFNMLIGGTYFQWLCRLLAKADQRYVRRNLAWLWEIKKDRNENV